MIKSMHKFCYFKFVNVLYFKDVYDFVLSAHFHSIIQTLEVHYADNIVLHSL